MPLEKSGRLISVHVGARNWAIGTQGPSKSLALDHSGHIKPTHLNKPSLASIMKKPKSSSTGSVVNIDLNIHLPISSV